jgi:hypothetical protein
MASFATPHPTGAATGAAELLHDATASAAPTAARRQTPFLKPASSSSVRRLVGEGQPRVASSSYCHLANRWLVTSVTPD